MNTKQSKKEHLDTAASHHEQAARFHREASQYYEAGKDYNHAAHQAVLAHGHALFAIAEANLAAKHSGAPLPAGSVETGLSAAKHHAAASELHTQAAQHMRRAAKVFDDDRSAVAHETQLGFSLASRAIAHGNEASRQYVASLREKSV